jgi:hypothetical protein
MMKAVAAALVLIAGAAVVLWFGNTLNSWVLGGLIGGLAAILLSIPISLTLFSYLSRRHDEELRAEAELAEDEYAQVYEYEDAPARVVRGSYAAEGYALEAGSEELYYEEEEYYQPRALPPRQVPRSLPAPQRTFEQSHTMNRLPAVRQNARSPLPRPTQKKVARGKDASGRRTTRHINTPGYEPGSVLRSQKSAALRAARLEKARQDDVEIMPTYTSKRMPTVRPDPTGQHDQMLRPRRTHQLSPQDLQSPLPTQRSRRSVDSTPPDELSPFNERDVYRRGDPETENLAQDLYPHTGSLRRPTGQIARNPQLSDFQAESPSGSIRRPLQRRAPYMYEDDPLREELSQQLRPPIVRRSSRLESQRFDEEE